MSPDADFNPESLVEDGLKLYSRGELDAALARWREVLERQPDNHRAREYLRYVEDNRAALEESFRLMREQQSGEPVRVQEDLATAPSADPARPGRVRQPISTPTASSMAVPGGRLERSVTKTDPSFSKLADEIADAAQRIGEEMSIIPGLEHSPDDEDYTPRLDLDDLKMRVAETKRRLNERSRAGARPEPETPDSLGRVSPPPPTGNIDALLEGLSPADLPTAPVLTSRLPPKSRPAPEEGSVSSRPTPSSGSAAVSGPFFRGRRTTPLTLIGGGGGGDKAEQDFAPLEATPVANELPEPSARLVPPTKPADTSGLLEQLDGDDDGAVQELRRDPVTPARLGRTPRPSSLEALASQAGPFDDTAERKGATYIGLGPDQPNSLETAAQPGGSIDAAANRSLTPVRESAEKLDGLLKSARQLHEQGTFEGSLWLCERVLAIDAACAEAQNLLRENQQILLGQYRELLGDPSTVPVVQIPQHEIMWHKLDHRAGFLLSRIDGQLSFEDLLDVSGMSEFEACRILSQLMSQGVIGPRR